MWAFYTYLYVKLKGILPDYIQLLLMYTAIFVFLYVALVFLRKQIKDLINYKVSFLTSYLICILTCITFSLTTITLPTTNILTITGFALGFGLSTSLPMLVPCAIVSIFFRKNKIKDITENSILDSEME
jgi:hypothetical protein